MNRFRRAWQALRNEEPQAVRLDGTVLLVLAAVDALAKDVRYIRKQVKPPRKPRTPKA